MNDVISKLRQSREASIRYKALVQLLGKTARSADAREAQQEIVRSNRVKMLLSERDETGRIPYHPYAKWYGAHWVLAALADIGYPHGDQSLAPLRDQVYEWLFSADHERHIDCVHGRTRVCASMEASALYSSLTLGLNESRSDQLAARLMQWQWPDGGWNCDRRPHAVNSSFMETLIPLRALALYARLSGERRAREAVERAAQIFLKRHLFKCEKDGTVISPGWLPVNDFVALHYPCYWYYDILFGLKVMAEAGFIGDRRCRDALDLLESKRLPDNGFPAQRRKYYRMTSSRKNGCSLVDWGGVSKIRMNEFVTVDALSVLKQAGRLSWSNAGAEQ